MQKTLKVVAAVIFEPGSCRFLLARRSPGKDYAGYWEFPGGKVEEGETEYEALFRELKEELRITPLKVASWFRTNHAYTHANVEIRFFRVYEWSGTLTACEHDRFHWVDPAEDPCVGPVLPANYQIMKILSLSEVYILTLACKYGVKAELVSIEKALIKGIKLVQLHDKELNLMARTDFAKRLRELTLRYHAKLLIGGDEELAHKVSADGVHLSSGQLIACKARPGFEWVAASCHNQSEMDYAEKINIDFVVLGSVLSSESHPGFCGLGWDYFCSVVKNSQLSVYAIGGQSYATLSVAIACGASGVAMLRAWRM